MSNKSVAIGTMTPVHFVWEDELYIDAPLSRVWELLLDYASWQNFTIKDHLAGPVDGEGEVVRLRKEEEGFVFPTYYATTLRIEPERRIMWKTYPDASNDEFQFFGIVDFRIRAENTGTIFAYTSVYEFLVPNEEVVAFRETQTAQFKALYAAVWPKLKELAERADA